MEVLQDERANRDARRDAEQPRRQEPTAGERERAPAAEQRQRIRRVAGERDSVVVGELADRREREDRDDAGNEQRSQKNLRAPRKSLVLTGTMRTSLWEFGASIISPLPSAIETWPTTGLS